MDSLLVDIERVIRQYLILSSEPLAGLAHANIEKYNQLTRLVCTSDVEQSEFCERQNPDINKLESSFVSSQQGELDALFSTLKTRQAQMMKRLWQYLDVSTQQQQEYTEQQQKLVNRWLTAIAFATFFLVVLISGRMAAPVKQLEEKIKAIGSGERQDDNHLDAFSGPNEFKAIFEKLIWLETRLDQLEALRQSFLRHASHEFKTPLSSIQEGCSILNEELAGPLTAQQKEVLSLLEGSTYRLRNLTEQLLEYNYFLQQQEPDLVELNPQEILSQLKSNHDLSFKARQQELNIECTASQFSTDHKLFTRIVENLLSNAQAYGDQGGKVHIQFKQNLTYFQLRVANTGPKVSQQHLSHLLEPFYRAELPRYDSMRGSGLGLSIVNDCARLLGGHVELGSDEEFDFVASVTLPIY
ncbi:sensor histidine kinase [Reinekea sp.]|uniref:sensor histidine kinase n=1 Tax=Reinekea sp. TaxID=1970455 RepID=UPI0039897314